MKKVKLAIFILVAIIFCVLLVIFFTGEKYEFVDCGDVNREAIDVSIINLIATPEKYHGQFVRLQGTISVGFEMNYISAGISGSKSCLWHDTDPQKLGITDKELKKMSGEYVTMEGTFNMYRLGHFGQYAGTIERVTRIYYHKTNPGIYYSQLQQYR